MGTVIGQDYRGNRVQFTADTHPVEADTTTNTQAGTAYSLQSSDNGCTLYFTNAGAVTVTVPKGLGIGFQCGIVQGGAGQVTPTASGTTINNRQSQTKTAGQYAFISLAAIAADSFILAGDTA